MKKITVSKLFLYRYRFIIGYVILGLAFLTMLFLLPMIAQHGLSSDEIESATSSYYLGKDGILNGDLVDLPYRVLQKFSIVFFGLSTFSVKLPSVIVGLPLACLLILLLNRWFKSNVSLLASCIIVLSTPFLYLAGSGTPLIMIVFWPTLLLWLGSKIQGEKRPKPLYCFAFAICLLLAIFTPYMLYFALFCVLFVAFQPHLRFVVKNLPKIPLIITGSIVILGITALAINISQHPDTIKELLFSKDFRMDMIFSNLTHGFSPLFSWNNSLESTFLSPLISLPIFSLAVIGLLSTSKGFFASRNSIASVLLVFCIFITCFRSDVAIFAILPFTILIAHGLKYLLEKWYGLFPGNPYARISALLPLTVLFFIVIIPGLLHYIYGYRYNPAVADQFSLKLNVIRSNLDSGTLVVAEDYDFYKILEAKSNLSIVDQIDVTQLNEFAVLGKPQSIPENYELTRIITSPRMDNSDIIYMYTFTTKGE